MDIKELRREQKKIVDIIKQILNEKHPKPRHKERVHNISELAKELGISRRCLYLFLKSSNPSFQTVYFLADYFDIDLSPRKK